MEVSYFIYNIYFENNKCFIKQFKEQYGFYAL